MKHLVLLSFILVFASCVSFAQLVETYPNSQRYLFNRYNNTGYIVTDYGSHVEDSITGIKSMLYSKYRDDTNTSVYGIAIPLLTVYHNSELEYFYNLPIDPHLFYDTTDKVYFTLEPTDTTLSPTLYFSTEVFQDNHYIVGNYLELPEETFNIYTPSNNLFPTLEVYFPQPINIQRPFGVGASAINIWQDNATDHITELGMLVFLTYLEPATTIMMLVDSNNNITPLPGQDSFGGGPMPIIAPPPCVPPFEIVHVGQQGRNVSFEWRAQYINSWCEAEYGPKDFAEGTGTVVGPLTPNAEYKCSLTIDSLENLTEYTLRVRSWCAQTNSFSDWRSLDFTTEEWYTVTARSNNESWGVVYGGDIYPAGTVVQLTAWPRGPEYLFTNWTDGSQQNPRTVTVTQDTLFKAIFVEQTTEGIDLAEGGATLTLSPNPAHSATTITAPFRIHGWQITDSYGRTVAEQSGLNDYTASADLRRLSPGLYIIRVNSGNGILTKKLIRL